MANPATCQAHNGRPPASFALRCIFAAFAPCALAACVTNTQITQNERDFLVATTASSCSITKTTRLFSNPNFQFQPRNIVIDTENLTVSAKNPIRDENQRSIEGWFKYIMSSKDPENAGKDPSFTDDFFIDVYANIEKERFYCTFEDFKSDEDAALAVKF